MDLEFHPPYPQITQLECYCHCLLTEAWFGQLGRLLNEYLVDVFSSMEDWTTYDSTSKPVLQHKVSWARPLRQKVESMSDESVSTIALHEITEDAEEADCNWPGHDKMTGEADMLHHNLLQPWLARLSCHAWSECKWSFWPDMLCLQSKGAYFQNPILAT